jgi:hypothetical protein
LFAAYELQRDSPRIAKHGENVSAGHGVHIGDDCGTSSGESFDVGIEVVRGESEMQCGGLHGGKVECGGVRVAVDFQHHRAAVIGNEMHIGRLDAAAFHREPKMLNIPAREI